MITPSVWIFSLIYYYVYAHKIYHGPCKTIDDVDETSLEAGIDAVIDGVDPQGDSDKVSQTNVNVLEKV